MQSKAKKFVTLSIVGIFCTIIFFILNMPTSTMFGSKKKLVGQPCKNCPLYELNVKYLFLAFNLLHNLLINLLCNESSYVYFNNIQYDYKADQKYLCI